MKKESLINLSLLLLAFVLLFISFGKKDFFIGEMLKILGSGILGFLLNKFLVYIYNEDWSFSFQTLLNWNNNIRISFSYLFRIQVDGTYFLVRGEKIKRFQPVGGVYQKYSGAESVLENIFQEDDEMKKGNENDLRGKVKGKNLKKFIRWFESRHNREITCHREFNEELIKSGILSEENFKELHYTYLGTDKTKIFTSKYYGKEFLLADIYELKLNEVQKNELINLKEKYDKAEDDSTFDYAFVTGDEIIAENTFKNKKDCFTENPNISNHTYKILAGEIK